MNRLSAATSPYLRQHAENPVDWYPWGPEALERARAEDRPILLSIGYAACHWCHVMAHESFENEETARLMNAHFVNIKVDREERPDIDGIYMSAVQAMTGQGGWPMTMFLTPDGVPFHAGTYYPPRDQHGMPAFRRVLMAVNDAWTVSRSDVERTAASLREMYARTAAPLASTGPLTPELLQRAFTSLAQRYDARRGGFEGAPKFPQTMSLDFLLRYGKRTGSEQATAMARDSFRHMARGGIYDQIGGGFHRYAVDGVWLIPHFEKMLYDNALLSGLGVHLWQATRDGEARRVAEETIDWVAREMTAPDGGFYSSLDADSEGQEGKFYVWSAAELDELLGADASLVKQYYGVTPGGNFEGMNILHVPAASDDVAARARIAPAALREALVRARHTLYDARSRRVRPGRDEKVLASWNGLMLRSVADAARILDRADYRDLALRNGEFLFREMVRDGRVMRSHLGGATTLAGYLEDHAALGLAALALYESTFERRWLDHAVTLARSTITWFWDETNGGFYDTAHDHEALITRPRDVTDNATPAGNSLAVELLLRLGDLLHDEALTRRAYQVLERLTESMARYGSAFGHLLGAADFAVHGSVQLALAGDPAAADFQVLARTAAEAYVPTLVLAGGTGDSAEGIALLADRPMRGSRAAAYLCRGYVCDQPVTTPTALAEQLARS